MHYRTVCYLLGLIGTGMLVCLIVPSLWSYFYEAQQADNSLKWGYVLLKCATISLMFILIGRKPRAPINHKEALLIVSLGWILLTYLGALPYYDVAGQSIVNGLFESASGLTTTGSSIFEDVEALPRSLLFWRCFSQWIGGLGIVVFFIAFFSFLGASGKALFATESTPKPDVEAKIRLRKAAHQAIGLYLLFSICGTIALLGLGLDGFNSFCHMGTALSTGGFSNFNASMGHFNEQPMIQWVLVILMIIGALPFAFHGAFWRLQWRACLKHEETFVFISLLSLCILIIYALLNAYMHETDNFRQAAIQCVSFITTTGFSSTNYQLWPAHFILLVLMIIGGCSGSTAGGLKIVRIWVACKVAALAIKKTVNPHHIYTLRINQAPLDQPMRDTLLLYIVLSFLLWGIGLFTLSLLEPQLSLEGILSSFFACWANAGVSFAEFGPTQNFNFCSNSTKILFVVTMLMGRIESYALLALCVPALWKRCD